MDPLGYSVKKQFSSFYNEMIHNVNELESYRFLKYLKLDRALLSSSFLFYHPCNVISGEFYPLTWSITNFSSQFSNSYNDLYPFKFVVLNPKSKTVIDWLIFVQIMIFCGYTNSNVGCLT